MKKHAAARLPQRVSRYHPVYLMSGRM